MIHNILLWSQVLTKANKKIRSSVKTKQNKTTVKFSWNVFTTI